MHRIYWTGYCRTERVAAIHQLEAAVQPFGFITDFKRFSDVALTVFIELPTNKIEPLYEALGQIMEMKEWETTETTSTQTCEIALELNFSSGTGQLSISTPSVPG
jgi:hypothetical protein